MARLITSTLFRTEDRGFSAGPFMPMGRDLSIIVSPLSITRWVRQTLAF